MALIDFSIKPGIDKQDTEVGAETEEIEVGRKHQSGLLLRPRGTGLTVCPPSQDRMTGMSRS